MDNESIPLKNLKKVLEKLDWMETNKIWPNGLRYLWTDSFGLVLLVSLYTETKDEKYLKKENMNQKRTKLRYPSRGRLGFECRPV